MNRIVFSGSPLTVHLEHADLDGVVCSLCGLWPDPTERVLPDDGRGALCPDCGRIAKRIAEHERRTGRAANKPRSRAIMAGLPPLDRNLSETLDRNAARRDREPVMIDDTTPDRVAIALQPNGRFWIWAVYVSGELFEYNGQYPNGGFPDFLAAMLDYRDAFP